MKRTFPLVDTIVALGVGLLTLALFFAWPFAGIHPFAADDVAVSAGLIPQGRMLPGLGVLLGNLIFRVFPYDVALAANGIVAKVMVSLCGVMAYVLFCGMMTRVSGFGARDWKRRRTAIRFAAAIGAVAFSCSDPMWRAATGLTGTTFVAFLLVLTFFLYVRLLETARGGYAVAALFAAGVLCAESPFGWAVLVFCIAAVFRLLSRVKPPEWSAFLDPIRIQRTKWSMTFVFLGAFVVGIFGEALAYVMLDGLRANGVTTGNLPVVFASAYWHTLTDAMNVTGGCLFAVCALVPFALTLLMIVPATDEERFLPFKYSLVYFAAGALAFLQLSPYPAAWFWSMADGVEVSGALIALGAFLSGAAFAWALFVLAVEVLCRDYEHIENVLCQGYLEDEEDDEEDGRSSRRTSLAAAAASGVQSVRLSFGRRLVLVLPLVLVALVVWGRRLPDDRALQELIHEFVCETVSEAAGVKYLFTDGGLDAMIRLEARHRGNALCPISMLGGVSPREVYMRRESCSSAEDRASMGVGAAEALAEWVGKKPERLSEVAVQQAFEIFGRNRRLKPTVYGALVRPDGGDAAQAESSARRCQDLAERIVAAHARGTWRHALDTFVKDRLLFAQFRLAVMSRLRAVDLDAKGKAVESLEAMALANRLDENNPSLTKILREMDWVRRQTGEDLTAREGLEVALGRADFVMARRFALPILKDDELEPSANFAVGMSYLVEGQYARAEEFLRRCLERKPREAAVYNNLALIGLKAGKLDEARQNVEKALEICPDSREIKETAHQIRQAQELRKATFGQARP